MTRRSKPVRANRWRAGALLALLATGAHGMAPAQAQTAQAAQPAQSAQAAQPTQPAQAAQPAPPAKPAPAPESYTADTTYAKLARNYPFIRIASREAPASVRAIEGLTYVRYGTRALQLDLYLPAGRAAGPAPAIVLVHGGGWNAGLRTNLAPLAVRLAQRGYAAAAITYRLAPEAGFPAAVHDAKAAVRWVRAHAAQYGIDAGRIAIGGASAGGQIASLAGVTGDARIVDPGAAGGVPGAVSGAVSAAVQAIVNIDGLSDFTTPEARKNEDDPTRQPTPAAAWLGGTYAGNEARWREASPTYYVSAATPPILFIGSGQPRFAVGREAMIEKMNAAGVASRVVMLPETPHSFWLFDPWLEPTVEAVAGFLDTHLRGGGGKGVSR